MQHELIANLAVGVDYIYRKYDRGTTNYTIGYEPGAPGYAALTSIYQPVDAQSHDPVRGKSATVLRRLRRLLAPVRVSATSRMTNPNYQVYTGVDITATKRFSNHWQMQVALTIQTNPNYFPEGSATFIDPDRTGSSGTELSTIPEYIFKAKGSYTIPWDISASANFNVIQGAYADRDDQRARRRSTAASTHHRCTNEYQLWHRLTRSRGARCDPVRAGQTARPGSPESRSGSAARSTAEADVGCVQHVQHQHHHGLLQQQPE